jgi:hypothetical protein
MSRIRSILLSGASWLALSSPAWAQDAGEPGWRPFVGSYAIVLLLVVLGLMVVCHTSPRARRARPNRFAD